MATPKDKQPPPARSVGDALSAPPGGWTFGGNTWQTFDDHIRRSVPGYDHLHDIIVHYAGEFVRPGSRILELGSSTGTLSKRLGAQYPDCEILGVDLEPAMVEAARAAANPPNVTYDCADVRELTVPDNDLSVLCYVLQFLPLADRPRVLSRLFDRLPPGGGLVLAEKVRYRDDRFQTVSQRVHYQFKRNQGYTQEEIDAKDASLEGILVPLYEDENVAMLKAAGFSSVNTLFQNTLFKAWLAIR